MSDEQQFRKLLLGACLVGAALLMLQPLDAGADPAHERMPAATATFEVPNPGTSIRLDSHTEVHGWNLANGWYFGRHRGDHSGLGFVWQKDTAPFPSTLFVSTSGIRMVHRF